MLLGNLYLLAWDYDRWKGLLPRDPGERHLGALPTLGLVGAAGLGLFGVTRLHLARLRHASMLLPALVVAAAALLALAILWLSLRKRPPAPSIF